MKEKLGPYAERLGRVGRAAVGQARCADTMQDINGNTLAIVCLQIMMTITQ